MWSKYCSSFSVLRLNSPSRPWCTRGQRSRWWQWRRKTWTTVPSAAWHSWVWWRRRAGTVATWSTTSACCRPPLEENGVTHYFQYLPYEWDSFLLHKTYWMFNFRDLKEKLRLCKSDLFKLANKDKKNENVVCWLIEKHYMFWLKNKQVFIWA